MSKVSLSTTQKNKTKKKRKGKEKKRKKGIVWFRLTDAVAGPFAHWGWDWDHRRLTGCCRRRRQRPHARSDGGGHAGHCRGRGDASCRPGKRSKDDGAPPTPSRAISLSLSPSSSSSPLSWS
jgi:hypothetical protein